MARHAGHMVGYFANKLGVRADMSTCYEFERSPNSNNLNFIQGLPFDKEIIFLRMIVGPSVFLSEGRPLEADQEIRA